MSDDDVGRDDATIESHLYQYPPFTHTAARDICGAIFIF